MSTSFPDSVFVTGHFDCYHLTVKWQAEKKPSEGDIVQFAKTFLILLSNINANTNSKKN